jgi:predicted GH43/DUF377 family glycosyl hydrolase
VFTKVIQHENQTSAVMKLDFEKYPGPIFATDGSIAWSRTHSQVPVVLAIDEDTLRVYYATRDDHNISRVSYFDVSANNPAKVLYRHNEPILEPGPLGSFDDAGVMPTCAIWSNGQIFLYYIGWAVRASVPFQNSVGIAASSDGINFSRVVPGPTLGTGPHDPYFVGTTWVENNNNKIFSAYYMSCCGWLNEQDKPEPVYDIKYAQSRDGINWQRDGTIIIARDEIDQAIASATIFSEKRSSHILYCSRQAYDYRSKKGVSYRIRIATRAEDGSWRKSSEERFVPSGRKGDWDEGMQAYPYVVRTDKNVYLFYNGNGFGQSGIGFGRILFD